MLADLVNRADVGMIQGRSSTSLASKAFQCLRVLREDLRAEISERNEAAKFGVLSLVDHAHPAATELFQDTVMRDSLADDGAGTLVRLLVLFYGPALARPPR